MSQQIDPSYLLGLLQLLKTPSPRTPESATHFNAADRLERGLEQTGDKYWGFVIYRGTYSDDTKWNEFLERFGGRIEQRLARDNGTDMLERFRLTVREDATRFEGATTAVIREDFEEWAKIAIHDEHSPDVLHVAIPRSARYNFCIYMDEESMNSVADDAKPLDQLDTGDQGWVKLLVREYECDEDDPSVEQEEGGEKGEEDDEDDEDEFEPFEGNTDEDVGWSKVKYQAVMVDVYNKLENSNAWYNTYRRPPEMAWL